MTKQEIFDTVARWLLRPGGTQSMRHDGVCAYRGPGGNKCAVGVLIPDDMYRPFMDYVDSPFSKFSVGVSVDRLIYCYARYLPEWFGKYADLLSDLQEVHDRPDNWSGDDPDRKSMREDLQRVCRNFNLRDDVLTEGRTSERV